MEIDRFKEIINKKGYELDSNDRKIFEREMITSAFGGSVSSWFKYGTSDVIEFILMDSAGNVLPQGETGELVRYIYMDDTNIGKYFNITESKERLNGASQYEVNTELLIRDAGYNVGIFKTQVSLLNRRVGSEEIEYDKLWIHEISPSRTEIRLVPLTDENHEVLPDLKERYDVMTHDGNFRDDTLRYIQEYIEHIDINKLLDTFLHTKGTESDGNSYIKLIRKEFGLNSFEQFMNLVYERIHTSVKYYVQHRGWHINNPNYGIQLQDHITVELSVVEIIRDINHIIDEVIDYTLPKRDIVEDEILTMEEQITIDQLKQLLKSATSDSIYESTVPDDIGSDIPKPVIKSIKLYVWSNFGTVTYTNPQGEKTTWRGKQGDSIDFKYINDYTTTGDIRTDIYVEKVVTPPVPVVEPKPTITITPTHGGGGSGPSPWAGGNGGFTCDDHDDPRRDGRVGRGYTELTRESDMEIYLC